MSCDCAGSSNTPPGATSGVNAQVGGSSFGGNVTVPNKTCGPPSCPTPPTSEAETRAPYCPTWLAQVTAIAAGRLLLMVESCLYTLKTKCSGMLHYDADTEQVTVIDPPYVSSIPQEKAYGFLAKVVPTIHPVCNPDSGECLNEVRQELAAQPMETASCGDLVVARAPLCGDVAPTEAADLDKQVRLDYLDPPLHEDLGCPLDVRFLVESPGTRGTGRNKVECKQWSLMRRLKLRASQWGMVEAGTPTEETAFVAILIPVSGGTEDDPCYELRLSAQRLGSGLPTEAENCDVPVYEDKGLATEGWKARPKGGWWHPLDAPEDVIVISSTGSKTATLPNFPSDPCGKVTAVFQTEIGAAEGGSGSPTQITVKLGDYFIGRIGDHSNYTVQESRAVVAAAGVTFVVTKSGSGAISATIRLIGYYY